MTELALQSAIVKALLVHYDFELGNQTVEEIASWWVKNYEVDWLPLAAIEALYQGRYKAISVEQILTLWKRRGKPIYHFNSEFEMLVRRHLPEGLREQFQVNPPPEKTPPPREAVIEKPESPELPPTPKETPEKTEVEETSQETLPESLPGNVKHTDFYSKLRSVADKNSDC